MAWRWLDRLCGALAALAAACLVAIACGIVFQATARSLGFSGSSHVFTFTEFGLLYIVMLASPWLAGRRGHVFIELLAAAALPARRRPALARAVAGLCAAICLLLAWYTGEATLNAYARGDTDMRSLDMPRWLLLWRHAALLRADGGAVRARRVRRGATGRGGGRSGVGGAGCRRQERLSDGVAGRARAAARPGAVFHVPRRAGGARLPRRQHGRRGGLHGRRRRPREPRLARHRPARQQRGAGGFHLQTSRRCPCSCSWANCSSTPGWRGGCSAPSSGSWGGCRGGSPTSPSPAAPLSPPCPLVDGQHRAARLADGAGDDPARLQEAHVDRPDPRHRRAGDAHPALRAGGAARHTGPARRRRAAGRRNRPRPRPRGAVCGADLRAMPPRPRARRRATTPPRCRGASACARSSPMSRPPWRWSRG